jgi:ubiquinone/menaquinone biosynthesis C-methylase UbiE
MTRPSALWPVTLGDKLIDWGALASVGGTQWIIGKRVLDVGPGRALDVQLFAPEAREYHALDCDQDVLGWVKHVEPSVFCFERYAEFMPFLSNYFDTVLDFSSFDNCRDPFQCYREAFRVLKPHGLLLSSFANRKALGQLADQHTQDPDELEEFLKSIKFWTRHAGNWEGARAWIAVQKYGEQLKGKECTHCAKVHEEGE